MSCGQKGHRAKGIGQKSKNRWLRVASCGLRVAGCGKWHRAERVEQDDLKPEYLTSGIWLPN